MDPFSSWFALIKSNGFVWYLLTALLVAGLFFDLLLKGYRELTGRDQDMLKQSVSPPKDNPKTTSPDHFARWRINLQDIVVELKHSTAWSAQKEGEALLVAALLKALSYVKHAPKPETPLETVADFSAWVKARDAFIAVSGEEAQRIANRGQIAFALDTGRTLPAAALVIPGEIYPGTVLGTNNPMVLWIGKDSSMELQAAAAFDAACPPDYYALKNKE